jgi:hypothetical protein
VLHLHLVPLLTALGAGLLSSLVCALHCTLLFFFYFVLSAEFVVPCATASHRNTKKKEENSCA